MKLLGSLRKQGGERPRRIVSEHRRSEHDTGGELTDHGGQTEQPDERRSEPRNDQKQRQLNQKQKNA